MELLAWKVLDHFTPIATFCSPKTLPLRPLQVSLQLFSGSKWPPKLPSQRTLKVKHGSAQTLLMPITLGIPRCSKIEKKNGSSWNSGFFGSGMKHGVFFSDPRDRDTALSTPIDDPPEVVNGLSIRKQALLPICHWLGRPNSNPEKANVSVFPAPTQTGIGCFQKYPKHSQKKYGKHGKTAYGPMKSSPSSPSVKPASSSSWRALAAASEPSVSSGRTCEETLRRTCWSSQCFRSKRWKHWKTRLFDLKMQNLAARLLGASRESIPDFSNNTLQSMAGEELLACSRTRRRGHSAEELA